MTIKQEVQMFETERDLRKVMRLAFFISQVKLHQIQKEQGLQSG